MSEWDNNFVTTGITLKIHNPCRSSAPILTVGNAAVPFLAVGCQKDNGHDGDHEWVLRWENEAAETEQG